jgi:hypothetical protein
MVGTRYSSTAWPEPASARAWASFRHSEKGAVAERSVLPPRRVGSHGGERAMRSAPLGETASVCLSEAARSAPRGSASKPTTDQVTAARRAASIPREVEPQERLPDGDAERLGGERGRRWRSKPDRARRRLRGGAGSKRENVLAGWSAVDELRSPADQRHCAPYPASDCERVCVSAAPRIPRHSHAWFRSSLVGCFPNRSDWDP